MKVLLLFVSCVLTLGISEAGWSVMKRFDFSSMSAVRKEWDIVEWPAGHVNEEKEAYTNSPSNLFVQSGQLIIRALRSGTKFTSARIHSKQLFSPARVAGKKLRVEFVAKVPTVMGAWPGLWLLGVEGVYGDWPQEGEIDVMEWVYQLKDKVLSSLHWKGPDDWSTPFTQLTMSQLASEWTTFAVEYSAAANDEYIQYYIKTQSGHTYKGKRATPDSWKSSWKPSPACSKLTPGATHCSPLAPFDNYMNIIINLAVGGNWGGCCGVNSYKAFDSGVDLSIKSVTVYQSS